MTPRNALLNKKSPAHSIKKEHSHLPKIRVLLGVGNIPGARMHTHLFGNRLSFLIRTRGFASPDYSGFARSENVFFLCLDRMVFLLSNAPKNSNVFFGWQNIFAAGTSHTVALVAGGLASPELSPLRQMYPKWFSIPGSGGRFTAFQLY